MKKRILSVILAIFVALSLCIPACAAGLDNFTSTRSYTEGQFTDVNSNVWYANSVKEAYELGLVNGKTSTTFVPDANITIAETIALACRLNDIYYGGDGVFKQGSPWYQVYIDYAIEKEIITEGQFSDYTKNATRAEFAGVLAGSVPEKALSPINTVTNIPDVKQSDKYGKQIYTLYNAGILTGNDDAGTFTPDSYIQRSAVAAIAARVADSSSRKTLSLSGQKSGDNTLYNLLVSMAVNKGTFSSTNNEYTYLFNSDRVQGYYSSLIYDVSHKLIYLSLFSVDPTGNNPGDSCIAINSESLSNCACYYSFATTTNKASGTTVINAETFNSTAKLEISNYSGTSTFETGFAQLTVKRLCLILVQTETYLLKPAGYSITDLGFSAFHVSN